MQLGYIYYGADAAVAIQGQLHAAAVAIPAIASLYNSSVGVVVVISNDSLYTYRHTTVVQLHVVFVANLV